MELFGLEAISRGADKAVLCDKSYKAMHIIKQNVEKLKPESEIQLINKDYLSALEILSKQNQKFDIVFLDPPYMTNFAEKASQKIIEYDLLNENGIIIIETDRKDDVIDQINKLDLFDIYDERKYGRVILLFLRQKSKFEK